MRPRPVLLSIAGFDPTGGAGILADLKVFAAHAAEGTAAITALTVQTTAAVLRVEPVAPGLLTATLQALAADLPPAGVKIGMLASAALLQVVAQFLRDLGQGVPIVVDPVLVSSSGALLLEPSAVELLRDELLPLATAVTPNLDELSALLGEAARGTTRNELEEQARRLSSRYPQLGVVVTGGHLPGAPSDLVLAGAAEPAEWVEGERVETRATHGTGCGYSSALLCGLARGATLGTAAREAKAYVTAALRAAHPMGAGGGSMHHLYRITSAGATEPT